MDRARLLGEIMAEYEDSIAVAGTHGKTTTTSMVSEILLAAGTDPTITVGGILPTISSNLKIGHSPYFVAEACEYFDSFLQFKPFVGVILNVESDHLDYFKNLANIRRSFHAFAERIPAKGALVINQAIENVAELTQGLDCTVETFGLADGADWQAKNIIHEPDGKNTFDVYYKGELFGNFHLNVPGDHNIANALASIAAAHFVGVCPADCQKGLLHFTGTERRFQKKGEKNGVVVIDDYAHHPTEIKAALASAKKVLTDAGVKYVVLGHSERREYFAETNETVNKKMLKAFEHGLTPIMCCGETLEQREQGVTMDFIRQQVKVGFQGVTADQAKTAVIAYEPIWAIGTGKTATTEQAQEVCKAIRECIAEVYDEATAEAIRIQYGGSVNAATAPELFAQPDIDGGLVGGASLKPDFGKIVNWK